MVNLPSRFAIGQGVLFQPDLSKIDGKEGTCEGGVRSEIVAISFTAGKVLYDIAVWDDASNDFYRCLPIQRVDSFMVCSQK